MANNFSLKMMHKYIFDFKSLIEISSHSFIKPSHFLKSIVFRGQQQPPLISYQTANDL